MNDKQYTPSQQNNGDDEIDLMELLSVFAYHKHTILMAVLIGIILGVIYVFSATPIYQANALLQIDKQRNSSLFAGISAGDFLGGGSSGLDTEIELFRSRQIIGDTIKGLNLDTEIKAQYFPIFGRLFHNLSGDKDPKIELLQFNATKDFQEKDFTLKFLSGNQYELTDPDGQTYPGVIAQPLQLKNGVSLNIKAIHAEDGQKFTLNQASFLATVETFSKDFLIVAQGKNTSLLSLSFSGKDPQKIELILNTLLNHYLTYDKNREARTASNGLDFIASELPKLNAKLTTAEDKLNQYRKKNGSLDLSLQSKDIVESLTNLEMQIIGLQSQRAALKEVYTPEHPLYRELNNKLSVLEKKKKNIEQQIASLPDVQQDIIRLNREVQINQTTYIQLLNKQQELNLIKAGSLGSAQIVDAAMTADKPIKPKKKIIVIVAGVLAGFLMALFILMREFLSHGIRSSEELENAGIHVLAAIPTHQDSAMKKRYVAIRFLKLIKTRLNNQTKDSGTGVIALTHPTGITIESIRALRTSLLFSIASARNNTLLITGPTPGVGKSFISTNLAAVMSQINKKVLLIDADMRKGVVHEHFKGGHLHNGLSDILSGGIELDKAIQNTQFAGLSFISRGNPAMNSTELLSSSAFSKLIETAQQQYDYVILDTPPILLVSDALLMGKLAATRILVAGFGLSKLKEVENSLMRLERAQVPAEGVILNNVTRTAKNYSSYDTYGEYYREH